MMTQNCAGVLNVETGKIETHHEWCTGVGYRLRPGEVEYFIGPCGCLCGHLNRKNIA